MVIVVVVTVVVVSVLVFVVVSSVVVVASEVVDSVVDAVVVDVVASVVVVLFVVVASVVATLGVVLLVVLGVASVVVVGLGVVAGGGFGASVVVARVVSGFGGLGSVPTSKSNNFKLAHEGNFFPNEEWVIEKPRIGGGGSVVGVDVVSDHPSTFRQLGSPSILGLAWRPSMELHTKGPTMTPRSCGASKPTCFTRIRLTCTWAWGFKRGRTPNHTKTCQTNRKKQD